MSRRNFFSRLFGRDKPVDVALFALQVVVHEYALPGLRSQLHTLIDDPYRRPGEETAEQRRTFYKRIVGLLSQCEPFFEYGFWEYVTDREAAVAGFDEWVHDIDAAIATEDTEIGDEVDDARRISADKRYVALTLLFLMGHANPVASEYDPEDDEAWTRAAFYELLQSVNRIDFELLHSDAIYLVPGSDEDGLDELDLADESWSHLEVLS